VTSAAAVIITVADMQMHRLNKSSTRSMLSWCDYCPRCVALRCSQDQTETWTDRRRLKGVSATRQEGCQATGPKRCSWESFFPALPKQSPRPKDSHSGTKETFQAHGTVEAFMGSTGPPKKARSRVLYPLLGRVLRSYLFHVPCDRIAASSIGST